MTLYNWDNEINASISVCDENGKIVYLNKQALAHFQKEGGERLLGSDILDCHPEPAKSILKNMMFSHKENIYSIEKNGKKRIIIQKPWFAEGVYKGFVEIVTEIPIDLPHFVRG
jgi:transcriptional regulator with PAS, ATPase and Fis domain